jgi:hypothetical protein
MKREKLKNRRLPHFLDNRLTDGGEDVSLTLRPHFIPGRFLVLIYVRGWVNSRSIVRLEGLGKLKNPMTSSGYLCVPYGSHNQQRLSA